MKTVRLGEILTDKELNRCSALWPSRERIRDEVITPNMTEINKRLGQENDPDYLSYVVMFALGLMRKNKQRRKA